MKNLFSSFKTPSWEQRDPEQRAAAVRDENAPELIAKLPGIAAQDPEPAVRRAALERNGNLTWPVTFACNARVEVFPSAWPFQVIPL